MSRGLYSDPYLKAMLEREPKLAEEFLMGIANSEYVTEAEVVSCVDLPSSVLEKAGAEACKNPNFPKKMFEEFLKDEELISKKFWKIFEYPNFTQLQIEKLSKSKDVNVRGLALVHPLGNSKELLQYLKNVISEKNHSSYVVIYICEHVELSDEIFNFLFSVHDYDSISKTIGQALWNNPTLSNEQRAALVLADIRPKDDSASDYWGDLDLQFISSIPYFQSLRTSFGYYKRQKFESIPTANTQVEEFFSKSGHHISAILPIDYEVDIEVSKEGLIELVSLELLHRLFWTELCQRDDFEIYRRNAYRVDDVFISHPILGREFDEADIENATRLGGVLYFDNQRWLNGEQELPPEQAAHELRAYEESLVTIVEEGNYEHLGQTLIALTFTVADLEEKYGFQLTDTAEDWMVEAATEFAEPDSFEVSADLNPYFGEVLSWQKLPDTKKEIVLRFLKIGYQERHSKLRSDSIHFLACMALHEATPKSLLKELSELGDPLIDEVLASR